MHQVFLLRHAKSSWKNLSSNDIDRPLNKRGRADAKNLAHFLAKNKINIKEVICSPSKRSLDTYRIIKTSLNKKHVFTINDKIYECSESVLIKLINKISIDTLIIGHNPSITNTINILCRCKIINIPTCTLVKIIAERGYFLSDITKPVK
jgi:phosphohistidine phosphatase